MSDKTKVTAILPCYNHAHFLEERIESVLSQTHPIDQIIFLDDASTDDSVESARNLLRGCSSKVDYILNNSNSGSPFAQWNLGIRHAQGDLIWIAETDDACDTMLIQKLYAAVMHANSVLSFSQSRYIDELSTDLGSALSYTESVWSGDFSSSFLYDGLSFRNKYMGVLNAIPNASAVLFRKEAYVQSGFANETMHFAGDWDIWIRLMSFGSVHFVADELNLFRCHSSTTRAKGRTAEAAAEDLACRLYVFTNAITPYQAEFNLNSLAIGLCKPGSNEMMTKAIGSLDWAILINTITAYSTLERVPSVGPNVWVLLGMSYFCRFCLCYLAAIPGKVRRLLLLILTVRS